MKRPDRLLETLSAARRALSEHRVAADRTYVGFETLAKVRHEGFGHDEIPESVRRVVLGDGLEASGRNDVAARRPRALPRLVVLRQEPSLKQAGRAGMRCPLEDPNSS